jgi:hypothetical protein
MKYVRYQSDIDPAVFAEEPDTPEGFAALQARVLAAQEANPSDPTFFIGSCVVVEREDAQEPQEGDAGATP